jgi:hypothetical protein
LPRRLLPLVLLLLATRVSASEPERPSRADLQRALSLYEQSVVRVRGAREAGPGIIVGTEGQVLTSVRHVNLDAAQVEYGGRTLPATVVLANAYLKVAVVAAPAGTYPAAAGKSMELDPNQMAELWERCSRLDQMDYFEVLMVERTAAPADIKNAFYRESRTYHPDRFFHLDNKELKDRVNDLYKRVTEAYYVLRDDAKRRQYTVNVSGPERAQKLRFTESSETETRAASKRQVEEQIGVHPKGRQFYQTGAADADAGRWASAERNLKMALTYEPANTRYKEKLAEVQKVLLDESRKQGDAFKIR